MMNFPVSLLSSRWNAIGTKNIFLILLIVLFLGGHLLIR